MDEEAAASSKRQRTPRKEGAPPRMEGTGSTNPRRAKSRIKLYGEPGPKRAIGEVAGTTRDERRRRSKKPKDPKLKAQKLKEKQKRKRAQRAKEGRAAHYKPRNTGDR